jgi:hypothetical protein
VVEGADALFDAKLEALAIITRHCPKLIIDSIMIWRSTRKPQALERVEEIQKTQYPNIPLSDLESRIKKRNSLLSNFILCRALIAIVLHLGYRC